MAHLGSKDQAAENMKGLIDRLTKQTDAQRIGCKKCGYAGHLTYQCYNTVQTADGKNPHEAVLAITSTSSDSEDELAQLESLLQEKKRQEMAKHKKKKRKLKHKRKRVSSTSSSSSSDSDKEKESRKHAKKKRKRSKKRRRKEEGQKE